jgi:hypothetical protein
MKGKCSSLHFISPPVLRPAAMTRGWEQTFQIYGPRVVCECETKVSHVMHGYYYAGESDSIRDTLFTSTIIICIFNKLHSLVTLSLNSTVFS